MAHVIIVNGVAGTINDIYRSWPEGIPWNVPAEFKAPRLHREIRIQGSPEEVARLTKALSFLENPPNSYHLEPIPIGGD